MFTWTLQLFKAENASKPGTQDITIPWAVRLRTRTLAGADGIPAGKSQGRSAGGLSTNVAPLLSPRQLPGLRPTVRKPWVLPWLQLQWQPLSVNCGGFRPLDREAEKSHLQDYFDHVLYLWSLWAA